MSDEKQEPSRGMGLPSPPAQHESCAFCACRLIPDCTLVIQLQWNGGGNPVQTLRACALCARSLFRRVDREPDAPAQYAARHERISG